jgi:hypothetical protein
MTKNVKHWLAGLISSVAGAVSAPSGALIADQISGNVHNYGLDALLSMSIGPAAVALFAYLKQKPLPDDEEPK